MHRKIENGRMDIIYYKTSFASLFFCSHSFSVKSNKTKQQTIWRYMFVPPAQQFHHRHLLIVSCYSLSFFPSCAISLSISCLLLSSTRWCVCVCNVCECAAHCYHIGIVEKDKTCNRSLSSTAQ